MRHRACQSFRRAEVSSDGVQQDANFARRKESYQVRANKRSTLVSLLITFSVLLSVCSGAVVGNNAGAQSPAGAAQSVNTRKRKASYTLLSRYATDLTR